MARHPKDLSFSNLESNNDFQRIYSQSEYNVMRRASKSFENLIALANDRERLTVARTVARKAVWRDTGEPPSNLDTLWECLEHASRGGLRAGILAGAIRSGVNIFVLIFRTLRSPKKFRIRLVLLALFGPDSWRFSAMLASFTFLYKFILNALPLIPIPDSLHFLRSEQQKRIRKLEQDLETGDSLPESGSGLSTGQQTPLLMMQSRARRERERERASGAEEGEKEKLEKERRGSHLSLQSKVMYSRLAGARWHAYLAGAISGLSVLFETKSRRITIAQQLFVRGLQGSWNAWSPRFGIKIPYGSVLVFTLACGPIMYAFLLRPEAIPRSYYSWILRAGKIHDETMKVNRQLVWTGKFDIPTFERLTKMKDNTPRNQAILDNILAHAKEGDFMGLTNGTCEMIHPWLDSCTYVEVERFVSVFTWMFPVYGALHVIPMILFKRGQFGKEPLVMLLRALKGTMRSSTFLSVFVFIYQSLLCMKNQAHASQWSKDTLPPRLRQALVGRGSFWALAFSVGLSLIVEEPRRRAELAMYVLPRGLESAWSMMRGRGYVPFIPFGDVVLSASALSMVMATYQNDPEHLSGLVRRVLYQFIGPN